MSEVLLFLPENFEETEAITTCDILRRAGVTVTTVSLTGSQTVTGAHNIKIYADELFDNINDNLSYDMLILPGGPGTENYKTHNGLLELLKKYNESEKALAAICAAPAVFGMLGFLEGKNAICYPGYEAELKGAVITDTLVITDGHVTTAKGPGAAAFFGLALVEILCGSEVQNKTKHDFILI